MQASLLRNQEIPECDNDLCKTWNDCIIYDSSKTQVLFTASPSQSSVSEGEKCINEVYDGGGDKYPPFGKSRVTFEHISIAVPEGKKCEPRMIITVRKNSLDKKSLSDNQFSGELRLRNSELNNPYPENDKSRITLTVRNEKGRDDQKESENVSLRNNYSGSTKNSSSLCHCNLEDVQYETDNLANRIRLVLKNCRSFEENFPTCCRKNLSSENGATSWNKRTHTNKQSKIDSHNYRPQQSKVEHHSENRKGFPKYSTSDCNMVQSSCDCCEDNSHVVQIIINREASEEPQESYVQTSSCDDKCCSTDISNIGRLEPKLSIIKEEEKTAECSCCDGHETKIQIQICGASKEGEDQEAGSSIFSKCVPMLKPTLPKNYTCGLGLKGNRNIISQFRRTLYKNNEQTSNDSSGLYSINNLLGFKNESKSCRREMNVHNCEEIAIELPDSNRIEQINNDKEIKMKCDNGFDLRFVVSTEECLHYDRSTRLGSFKGTERKSRKNNIRVWLCNREIKTSSTIANFLQTNVTKLVTYVMDKIHRKTSDSCSCAETRMACKKIDNSLSYGSNVVAIIYIKQINMDTEEKVKTIIGQIQEFYATSMKDIGKKAEIVLILPSRKEAEGTGKCEEIGETNTSF